MNDCGISKTPLWTVNVDGALSIHSDVIEKRGGMSGVLNMGVLESALAAPFHRFDGKFLNPDIYSMAASLFISLSKNHPFLDGNKRTAVSITYVFIGKNGYRFTIPSAELDVFVVDVVNNKLTKEEVIAYFKKVIVPKSS